MRLAVGTILPLLSICVAANAETQGPFLCWGIGEVAGSSSRSSSLSVIPSPLARCSMSTEEEVPDYYPQRLLDIMTREELDELVREILADLNMVNSFIRTLPPPSVSHEARKIWTDALDRFVRVRDIELDAFELIELQLFTYFIFRMQEDLNRERLTSEQFGLLYRPQPPSPPRIKFGWK